MKNQGFQVLLTEGITHVEDLDIKDFIRAVRNIANMQATEKLDGANLWFGLDEDGKLYTSRAGKKKTGAEKYYNPSDYPLVTASNGFRATHAALEAKEIDIKRVLDPGDTIEIEVLYGRQPNAVTYGLGGKNFIAFLRGVESTSDDKVAKLVAQLNNNEVTIKTTLVDTDDGISLTQKLVEQTFRFVGVQKIDSSSLKSIDVAETLKELEDFLDDSSGVGELTNFELMTTSLGSIPKDERAAAKERKDNVLAIVKTKFKVRIKKELLDKFVSKIKPALSADDLSGDEDNGVEGVVLRDPTNGEQIKIVDKDGFTTINQFNFAVRNQVASMVKTTDDSASLESRGGLVGVMKIRIAELLGNKDMARALGAKKVFMANKGETPTETLRNVAKTLNGDDVIAVKKKIQAIITATIKELGQMLDTFQKTKDDVETYRLKLKNGKAMGLSPEIIKRTLMVFAETRRDLTELLTKVRGAKTFDQVVAVIYGKVARAVHATEDEEVSEDLESIGDLLLETRNYTDVARYKDVPDAWTMLNCYLATLMAAVLIFKADDKPGVLLLKDKAYYRLNKWSPNMSALNFWGYPVWRSSQPTVAKLTSRKIAAELFRQVRKVPPAWVKFLHMDLSFGSDVNIDWDDHYKTIKVLMQFPGISTDRVNSLLNDAFHYDELAYDDQVKFLPKLYFYIRQFVPTSPLITRLRIIQDDLLLNGPTEKPLNSMEPLTTVSESLLQLIVREEEGDANQPITGTQSTSTTQTVPVATRAGDISPHATKIGKGEQIIRRKRNPDVRRKKFERPKEDK